MIHELRIYHCVPGRLPALHRRFENVTLELWKRHGIRQVGFWTVAIGPSSAALYYLLEWDSLADREQRWNAFASDPDWLRQRADSEKDGPIVAKLTAIDVPAAPAEADANGTLKKQIASGLSQDVITAYADALERGYGVSVNQQQLQEAQPTAY